MKLLKASLTIAVLLVIVVSAHQILALTSPAPRQEAAAGGPADAQAFAGMPVGVTRSVELAADESTFAALSPLEQRQQLLDWLLYAAASSAGLGQQEARQLFYDLPPLRRGYMEPVANFDYDQVRSRRLDSGDVIALVPKAGARQRLDDLAHIADEERKSSGKTPARLIVFEYQLDPGLRSATLARLDPVAGQELFSARAGYVESAIASIPDLQRFLEQADDVTLLRQAGDGLVLGGRKLQARPYRGLSLEDVAALWQSEAALGRQRSRVKEFKDRWEQRSYRTEAEKAQGERDFHRELADLQQDLGQTTDLHGLRLADSSGFSLDPAYDRHELLKLFASLEGELRRAAADALVPLDDVDAAGAALRQAEPDETPFLKLLAKLQSGGSGAPIVEFLKNLISESPFSFQHARYDGELRGTHVGMVLFYTDLLAKLWALDYLSSAPRPQQLEDFVPMLRVVVSPVYTKGLEELSGTRLWFGPQDRGYQRVADGVLLARNSTRVYAASSDPLEPGKEAEPNAQSAAFLGWWNNHYEEVARFEPEYEQLNEVMKWSLLLGWLADSGQLDRLSFLRDVKVDHGNWFPTWASRQTNLRYSRWDGLRFYEQGHLGVDTESMPILRSAAYEGIGLRGFYLAGGVSLGGKSLFAEREALTEDVAPALRRSDLDYKLSRSGTGTLVTHEHVQYQIAGDTIVAAPRPGAKLRDFDVEVANRPFEFRYDAGETGLGVLAQAGADPVGRLSVRQTAGAFEVAFKAHDFEQMHGIVRQLAAHPDQQIEDLLAAHRGVGAWIRSGDFGDKYLVHMKTSGKWLELSKEGAPSADIAPGVSMRGGGWTERGGDRWNLAWVDRGRLGSWLGSQDLLRVEVPGSLQDGLKMTANVRGPPGMTPVELRSGELRLHAWGQREGATQVFYFKLADLPPALRSAPEEMRRLVQAPGVAELIAAQAHLESGAYDAAAADLARDPINFKRQADALRPRLLAKSDRLLAEGRGVEALQELDSLLAIYGNDPDLLVRHGLAALRAKDPALAAVDAERAAAAGPRPGAGTFDLIDRRLAADGLMGGEQQSIGRYAAYMDLQDQARAGRVNAGVEPMLGADGSFEFQVALFDRLAAPRRIDRSEILSGRVYVDAEDPSLQNVDWTDPQHPVIDEVVSHQLVASELPSWEIGHAAPQVIREAATGRRFRLASRLAQPSRYTPISQDPCSTQTEEHRLPGCDGKVHLLRRAAPAQAAELLVNR